MVGQTCSTGGTIKGAGVGFLYIVKRYPGEDSSFVTLLSHARSPYFGASEFSTRQDFLQKLLGLPRNGHKFKNLPLAHSHGAVIFSGLDLEGS